MSANGDPQSGPLIENGDGRRPRMALCLPGGGVTGAMFQIGALAALEDSTEIDVNAFDLYVGTSSGATVAAVLAGGQPVRRIYRSFLDPADVYFPLERKHILRIDLVEWRRMLLSGMKALGQGSKSLWSSSPAPSPSALWEELARLYDSLPAGIFHLESYERFLADFLSRRGIPNSFTALPRELLILAHDLDSGEPVLFGYKGYEHVPVTRACIASAALPPFFSPVRIGDRHYIDAGIGRVSHLDAALQRGATVILLVNPMVPFHADRVPTGHGEQPSLRNKGSMWVATQASRIAMQAVLHNTIARIRKQGDAEIVVIEPEPTDGVLFLYNAANFGARRAILEYAYRTTRQRLAKWFGDEGAEFRRAGFRLRSAEQG